MTITDVLPAGLAPTPADSGTVNGWAVSFVGQTVKNRAAGALAFAKFATEVAKNYPVTVALHTDHCPKPALEDFVGQMTGLVQGRAFMTDPNRLGEYVLLDYVSQRRKRVA